VLPHLLLVALTQELFVQIEEEVLALLAVVSVQTLALVAQVLVQVARVLVQAMAVLLLLVAVQGLRNLAEERFYQTEEALLVVWLVVVILHQLEA
jgi:hypothetical protein